MRGVIDSLEAGPGIGCATEHAGNGRSGRRADDGRHGGKNCSTHQLRLQADGITLCHMRNDVNLRSPHGPTWRRFGRFPWDDGAGNGPRSACEWRRRCWLRWSGVTSGGSIGRHCCNPGPEWRRTKAAPARNETVPDGPEPAWRSIWRLKLSLGASPRYRWWSGLSDQKPYRYQLLKMNSAACFSGML